MLISLALLLAAQGSTITGRTFLSGLEEVGGNQEFWTWGGHPSCYVKTFMGHRESSKVAAEAKQLIDPQLWEAFPVSGWHNTDGTLADPCSLWDGRKGTIYEGWSVQINWNWGPLRPSRHKKSGDELGHAPGWTYVAIH